MIPDEREWQAQERAMQCERAGLEIPASDTLGTAYLAVAQALNQAPEPLLPADFAARVAALAASGRQATEIESRLERFLLLGLSAAFGVCALAAVVIYGSNWLGNSFSMLAQVGTLNLAWPMALAACLGVSWFSEAVRRRMTDEPAHPV
ncbi:hypothetical protein [Dokdonella sp.]|uniref:hypothetical protein n=1 Tax=Dokdonella sp. TaxID=2291710 RepID=UPI0035274A07